MFRLLQGTQETQKIKNPRKCVWIYKKKGERGREISPLVVGSNPTEPAFHSTDPAELLSFPVQMMTVDLIDELETKLNRARSSKS